MKEKDFQRWVTDVANRFHWLWWHVPAPMRFDSKGGSGFVGAREAAGMPDLVLVHVGWSQLMFVEVKGDGGKLSPAQINFLEAVDCLGISGVSAYAWWPGMEDEVERILRGH